MHIGNSTPDQLRQAERSIREKACFKKISSFGRNGFKLMQIEYADKDQLYIGSVVMKKGRLVEVDVYDSKPIADKPGVQVRLFGCVPISMPSFN